MSRFGKLVGVASALAILVASGLLVAQPGDPAPTPPDPVPADTPPDPAPNPAPNQADPATPEVTVPMGTKANLTSTEMKDNAAKNLEELRSMLGRLVELRQVARQSSDVIKLTCVNDQLLLYKQLVNVAENAQTELVEAIAQENEPEQYHYHGQIVLALEKGKGIRNDAEGCIGEELIFLGPTEVTVDAPPVDDLGDGPELDFDPPAFASPYN